MPRSEAEITGGFIDVRFGPDEVTLPTLNRVDARGWRKLLAGKLSPVLARFEQTWKPGDDLDVITGAGELAIVAMDELILAYDKRRTLGGSKGLDRLDDAQRYALFKTLVEVSHPFAGDLQTVLMQMAMLRVQAALKLAPSTGASSTNGPSEPGDSTQPPSTVN